MKIIKNKNIKPKFPDFPKIIDCPVCGSQLEIEMTDLQPITCDGHLHNILFLKNRVKTQCPCCENDITFIHTELAEYLIKEKRGEQTVYSIPL